MMINAIDELEPTELDVKFVKGFKISDMDYNGIKLTEVLIDYTIYLNKILSVRVYQRIHIDCPSTMEGWKIDIHCDNDVLLYINLPARWTDGNIMSFLEGIQELIDNAKKDMGNK